MLRRKLTRIELKLDDLEEWNAMKKEKEMAKRMQTPKSGETSATDNSMTDIIDTSKAKKDMVHERIGYDPSKAKSSTRT